MKREKIVNDNSRFPELPCQVMVKFKCKQCGRHFLEMVDEKIYKYVIKDPLFLNSRICSECKKKNRKKSLEEFGKRFPISKKEK